MTEYSDTTASCHSAESPIQYFDDSAARPCPEIDWESPIAPKRSDKPKRSYKRKTPMRSVGSSSYYSPPTQPHNEDSSESSSKRSKGKIELLEEENKMMRAEVQSLQHHMKDVSRQLAAQSLIEDQAAQFLGFNSSSKPTPSPFQTFLPGNLFLHQVSTSMRIITDNGLVSVEEHEELAGLLAELHSYLKSNKIVVSSSLPL